MKKVKLKFLGLGYNEFYQANVMIYDFSDNLIYEGITYNGELEICLDANEVYKINAYSLNEIINTYFYVSNLDNYIFIFDRAKFIKPRKIIFSLIDYHYNLPIEKGELYLWQK